MISDENDMPLCHTCKSKIEYLPYRIVTIEDNNSKIHMMHYHYFFPCWDLEHFFQEFGDETIVSLAYSYDEEILKQPMILKNISQNLDLWT